MKSEFKSIIRKFLPRTIKQYRILAGPLKDSQIVTSWHDYPAAITGKTELALLCWFEKNVRTGETWLDVGAHYGYTALALSRLVGSEGRVFAFEPVISTAGHLSRTKSLNGLNQLTIIPLGLSVTDSFTFLSLPSVRGMVDSTGQIGNGEESGIFASLDWLWRKIDGGNSQVNGIKIDVQGMELLTLQGMVNTLRRFRPKLVIEFHKGVDRKNVLSLLQSIGYDSEGKPIEPVNNEIRAQYIDDCSYIFE